MSENVKNKKEYRELFKARDYMIYLIANTISRFGDSLDAIAFSYLMYQITGSAALIAVIMGVNFLPSILLQPFTGVFADYYSKKKIQFICNFGRAASVFFVIWLYMTNSLEVYHLFIFVITNSTLEAFQIPSGRAMIPLILKQEQYESGLAFQETMTRLSELVGTGAAGGLIAFLGVGNVLLIDGFTFIICGLMMLALRYKEEVKKEKITFTQYFYDFKKGLEYIKGKKVIINIFIMAMMINFFFTPLNSIQIPYLLDILELGPESLSVLGVSITLGMLFGSVIYPMLTERMTNKHIFIVGGLLISMLYGGLLLACLFQDPLMKNISVAFGTFIGGLGITIVSLFISVLFAKEVEPEYMGRVSGVSGALSLSAIPLASFITAALVYYVELPVMVFVSLCLVVVFFLLQFFNKYLQES